jgi:uncharacterized membrane protein YfcA
VLKERAGRACGKSGMTPNLSAYARPAVVFGGGAEDIHAAAATMSATRTPRFAPAFTTAACSELHAASAIPTRPQRVRINEARTSVLTSLKQVGGGLAVVAGLTGALRVPQHQAQLVSLVLSLILATIPAAYIYWRAGRLPA